MLTAIYEMIITRITGLNIFTTVGSALTSEPGALPAADIWLAEDKELSKKPAVIRELTWVIRVTVSHEDAAGASQEAMFDLLDSVRNAFAGWEPTGYVGIKGHCSVPQVKIESYSDHGSTVYLVSVVMQVFAEAFRAV